MEEKRPSLESPLIPIAQGKALESTRKGFNKEDIIAEMKKQLWLACPLVLVNLLVNGLQVISIMFVGHLGELALAGASMASSFASVTGFSLLVRKSTLLIFFYVA